MTNQDSLRLLEETLEMKPHSLTGQEALKNLEGWDSLATMGFIATVDKKLGLPLRGQQVAQCKTVAELVDLVGKASANRAA